MASCALFAMLRPSCISIYKWQETEEVDVVDVMSLSRTLWIETEVINQVSSKVIFS